MKSPQTWLLDQDESSDFCKTKENGMELELVNNNVDKSFSQPPKGTACFLATPKIPPPPHMIVVPVLLESLFGDESGVECMKDGPCEGDAFFDALETQLSAEFNSQIFLSQPPDPSNLPVPSTVCKFGDFCDGA